MLVALTYCEYCAPVQDHSDLINRHPVVSTARNDNIKVNVLSMDGKEV